MRSGRRPASRDATIARAIRRDARSSPKAKIASAISASLERSVPREREAALRAVELHRGDPEIEERAVDLDDPRVREGPLELGEIFADERDAVGEIRREPRARIAVEGDDPAAAPDNRPRVTARAEGRVDVRPAVADAQTVERLGEHDRNVLARRRVAGHRVARSGARPVVDRLVRRAFINRGRAPS